MVYAVFYLGRVFACRLFESIYNEVYIGMTSFIYDEVTIEIVKFDRGYQYFALEELPKIEVSISLVYK